MNRTSIEWTHRPATGGAKGGFTWNPIRARRHAASAYWQCPNNSKHSLTCHGQALGKEHPYCSVCPPRVYAVFKSDPPRTGTFCTKISPGCTRCYASTINKRFGNGLEYTVPNLGRVEFYIDEKMLLEPIKRKKRATIFVGDMFDLFHESIPDVLIDRVFAAMSLCPHHTFQLLTKRAARMREYFADSKPLMFGRVCSWHGDIMRVMEMGAAMWPGWPLPNVWIGASIEDKQRADERIADLLETPAAVHFLSVEPLLEAIDLTEIVLIPGSGYRGNALKQRAEELPSTPAARIDWVICGGESGPGARPFNIAWAEDLLQQCKAAGVPFFMKQIGTSPSAPYKVPGWSRLFLDQFGRQPSGEYAPILRDRKGGDPAEWPEHLRVRGFPR